MFGSARTKPDDRLYRQASEVAGALAERGWMVVTGAGPGIMQAAAEGAGADRSIGVSIRLPFEEKPNAVIATSANNVAMKYFFTRKLMLVKESHGFVCVPGGFGTLDELFELLTLQQTGKAEPMPIVLLDAPGGSFWTGLRDYVEQQLLPAGVISPDDFDRVTITDSVTAAAEEITGFWRNYDSLRWVGKRLVLRLRAEPTDAEVDELTARFGALLIDGRIEKSAPLTPEREDDDRVDLPRLVMTYDQFEVGIPVPPHPGRQRTRQCAGGAGARQLSQQTMRPWFIVSSGVSRVTSALSIPAAMTSLPCAGSQNSVSSGVTFSSAIPGVSIPSANQMSSDGLHSCSILARSWTTEARPATETYRIPFASQ